MGVKQEKARQGCWCFTKTGRQLQPVQPTRCHKMFAETAAFSKRLHGCELQIQALKKATDGMISISEKTLTHQLPQVWDMDATGAAHPVAGTGNPLVHAGTLPRSRSMDLQSQTYDGITHWQTEHTRLKGRMAELDRTRLRLDEARRKYYKASQKHLKENVMQQDNVTAQGPVETEDPVLVSARAAYQKAETETCMELRAHIEQARLVQGWLTHAMRIMSETLAGAAMAHAVAGAPPAPIGGTTAAPIGGTTAGAGGPVATIRDAPAASNVPAGAASNVPTGAASNVGHTIPPQQVMA